MSVLIPTRRRDRTAVELVPIWDASLSSLERLAETELLADSVLRILGIDPGLNTTGYAVIEVAEADRKLIEAGIIRSTERRATADMAPGSRPFTME